MKSSQRNPSSCIAISGAALLLFAGCASEVVDPVSEESDEVVSACAPEVPGLAGPAGNKLAFAYDAIGVQIYGCDANATGYGWVLRGPEATLYGKRGKPAGIHYAGPTWESNDGSTVVASKLAEYAADPTSIPWLLLGATAHTGKGRMSDVSYIHRLDTAGGKAPATGCDAGHTGETTRVDYTATYYFYEARGKK
ncbi:MAG: DUF3455 domain-containing protein [Polyangiaceae bacterium]